MAGIISTHEFVGGRTDERNARIAELEGQVERLQSIIPPDRKYNGKLYAAYRSAPSKDWNATEEAICDTLAQGGIRAWPGDGVSMIAQLIWRQIERAAERLLQSTQACPISVSIRGLRPRYRVAEMRVPPAMLPTLWAMRIACPAVLAAAAVVCAFAIMTDHPMMAAIDGILIGFNIVLTWFEWFVLKP